MIKPSSKIKEDIQAYQVHVLNYGRCPICERGLSQGESIYAGTKEDGTMIVACVNCKKNLTREIRHYVYHPKCYKVPSANTLLWRYVDFPKFMSLLDSGELFFTRADKFEDKFEGARGFNFHKDAIYSALKTELTFKVINKFKSKGVNPTELEIEAEIRKETQAQIEAQQEKRKEYYVSCWHDNELESEAMWKLYISAKNQGVAIQTTVERLCYSLEDNNFEIGAVNYISFKDPLDVDSVPVWYKRTAFKHEKEVRAIINQPGLALAGKPVKVDLDLLIEKVYISPSAPEWFASLVESMLVKYGLDKKVEHSKLDVEPIY